MYVTNRLSMLLGSFIHSITRSWMPSVRLPVLLTCDDNWIWDTAQEGGKRERAFLGRRYDSEPSRLRES